MNLVEVHFLKVVERPIDLISYVLVVFGIYVVDRVISDRKSILEDTLK